MSGFKAKMHQIHFLLRLCPRPRWGSLQCPPDLCLYSRGLLVRRWRETGEGEEKVKGKEGERWREGFGPPKNFGVASPMGRDETGHTNSILLKHPMMNSFQMIVHVVCCSESRFLSCRLSRYT